MRTEQVSNSFELYIPSKFYFRRWNSGFIFKDLVENKKVSLVRSLLVSNKRKAKIFPVLSHHDNTAKSLRFLQRFCDLQFTKQVKSEVRKVLNFLRNTHNCSIDYRTVARREFDLSELLYSNKKVFSFISEGKTSSYKNIISQAKTLRQQCATREGNFTILELNKFHSEAERKSLNHIDRPSNLQKTHFEHASKLIPFGQLPRVQKMGKTVNIHTGKTVFYETGQFEPLTTPAKRVISKLAYSRTSKSGVGYIVGPRTNHVSNVKTTFTSLSPIKVQTTSVRRTIAFKSTEGNTFNVEVKSSTKTFQ